MFLKSNVVESFIALHEGSIEGGKTQPVIELYPQEKYAWFGHVTGEHRSNVVNGMMADRCSAGERKTTPFPWDPDAK